MLKERQQDTKAVIPDSSYAGIYQATLISARNTVHLIQQQWVLFSNVGLMAQKAEEYGSHDKTFEISTDGTVSVVDAAGTH
jgi:isocitrate dehydrogenase